MGDEVLVEVDRSGFVRAPGVIACPFLPVTTIFSELHSNWLKRKQAIGPNCLRSERIEF
jgi:hypothetical protein